MGLWVWKRSSSPIGTEYKRAIPVSQRTTTLKSVHMEAAIFVSDLPPRYSRKLNESAAVSGTTSGESDVLSVIMVTSLTAV